MTPGLKPETAMLIAPTMHRELERAALLAYNTELDVLGGWPTGDEAAFRRAVVERINAYQPGTPLTPEQAATIEIVSVADRPWYLSATALALNTQGPGLIAGPYATRADAEARIPAAQGVGEKHGAYIITAVQAHPRAQLNGVSWV